jgi:ArsR family transcriptional regulator, arsenate/arsenite/antimonite-responsive transcriptional repressor
MTAIPAPVPAPAVSDLDLLFRGVADETRLRILNLLAAGELCVGDIVAILELPQSTVSRHLAYLRRAGLVDATRARKFAHYRLAEPRHPVHRNIVDCVRSCFTGVPSLDRERAAGAQRLERPSDVRCV